MIKITTQSTRNEISKVSLTYNGNHDEQHHEIINNTTDMLTKQQQLNQMLYEHLIEECKNDQPHHNEQHQEINELINDMNAKQQELNNIITEHHEQYHGKTHQCEDNCDIHQHNMDI